MKIKLSVFALLLTGLLSSEVLSQSAPAYAFQNVTLHNSDGTVSKSATIVWRNGVIEAAGESIQLPFDAYVIDGGDSLHVYPGFIDGLAFWGSPELPKDLKQLPDPGNPPYDRAGIQPERTPSVLLEEDKSFEEAMKKGFTTAALQPEGYMLPGQVEIFSISPENTRKGLYKEQVALGGSFKDSPGGWSAGAYPSTLMGVMAQFRQLMFDAKALQEHIRYYSQNPEMPVPDRDEVVEAMFPLVNKTKPLFFEVDSKENIERLFALQDQFGFEVVIVSGKEAYAKAAELKKRKIPVLAGIEISEAPVWYKKAEKEEKPEEEKEAEDADKEPEEEELSEEEQAFRDRQLQAWKEEARNIRSLLDAGVSTGYASVGIDLKKDWRSKIKVLLEEGELSTEELLSIMTINTAAILGIDKAFGTIEKGKNASFVVYDKPMTEKKASVLFNVSNGTVHEFSEGE